MAEQEVRPQQLSIAEIARLWSAETGDSAEDVERELAEWAYAASADGAQVGLESGSDKKSPAKLKIEPDPQRELCREDLEAFCRESDRLVPHVWPEAPPLSATAPALGAKSPIAAPKSSKSTEPGDATAARAPRDMSRLVVRAMDRMGPSVAPRQAPRDTGPVTSGAAVAVAPAEPVKPVADKKPAAAKEQRENKTAAPGDTQSQTTASIEELDGPRRKPNARPARAAKIVRAAKKSPAARQVQPSSQKSKLGSLRDIASKAKDVPVKVMGPAPALAAPKGRPASAPVSMIAAAGLLGGALIAAAGGAAWLEFEGPGLESFLLGESTAKSELVIMEQRANDLAARTARANGENERLSGLLNDTQRQNDTLRARIEDISSLGPRLTETQKANTELRRTIDDLTVALDAARKGGSAAVRAIEKELKSTRDALNKATAAARTARNDAGSLTESLAIAQGDIEAGKLARLRLERDRDAGAKTLEAANIEIENLAQSGTAAQAVVHRLETELGASEQQLQARAEDQAKLQTQLAALNKELTETRARAAQLAAAETETRRLGAALDAATLEIARQQTAADSSQRETAKLAFSLDEERQAAAKIRDEVKVTSEKNRELTKGLALAQVENTDLSAETANLNIQAAQLSEFLATARDDAKTLKADRATANAKVRDLERDLASAKDESAKIRASLEGTSGASTQLAARLAAAEDRVAKLSKDRQEAATRVDTLAKELETAKAAAAKQGAARTAAQGRVESLVVSMAAAKAEVLHERTKAQQAEKKSDLLLEAVDSWKAEAKILTANLAALKDRTAPAAASDLLPQAGRSKETLIGAAPVSPSGKQKLGTGTQDGAVHVASQQTGVTQASPQTAKIDRTDQSMLARGDEFLGRGDIASARLFFELAATRGETGALVALGRTYDPRVLGELGVLGAFANPAIATLWYERALAAGNEEASNRLEALSAWQKP